MRFSILLLQFFCLDGELRMQSIFGVSDAAIVFIHPFDYISRFEVSPIGVSLNHRGGVLETLTRLILDLQCQTKPINSNIRTDVRMNLEGFLGLS